MSDALRIASIQRNTNKNFMRGLDDKWFKNKLNEAAAGDTTGSLGSEAGVQWGLVFIPVGISIAICAAAPCPVSTLSSP